MNVELVDVYAGGVRSDVANLLYILLAEREPHESISHRRLPDFPTHKAFIAQAPYEAWYMIHDGPLTVGSIYLTRQNEIGIAIFRCHRGSGYASAAIRRLMELHPRDEYHANINPRNQKSIDLFKQLGFNEQCQITLRKRASSEEAAAK